MRLTTSPHRPSGARRFSLATAALIVGALLAIFALDRATGSAPLQHLYYLPIIRGGLSFLLPGGLAVALAAIVLYHVANPHLLTFQYGESDLVQIGLFLAVGVITAKLRRDANHLRRLALTDDLTGLHNLRSFEASLAAMVRAAKYAQTRLTLLVLDVDRLKSLNDVHGHLTGAEAVRTIGHIIGAQLPSDAIACRYGGDEFVIAIPGQAPADARQIADALCRAVHESAPRLAGRPFPAGTLSISVGGASATFDGRRSSVVSSRDDETGERLFRAADAALYRAKANGRNQACVA